MSYDLDHEKIYSLTEAPVVVDGQTIIGSRHTLVTKEADGCFGLSVSTAKSDIDPARMDIITLTPTMLSQILAARNDS